MDWKKKLSSRKFWVAVTGFVTALLVLFNADDLTIQQTAALVSAMGTLIAYIVGEGMVDCARLNNSGGETNEADTKYDDK